MPIADGSGLVPAIGSDGDLYNAAGTSALSSWATPVESGSDRALPRVYGQVDLVTIDSLFVFKCLCSFVLTCVTCFC